MPATEVRIRSSALAVLATTVLLGIIGLASTALAYRIGEIDGFYSCEATTFEETDDDLQVTQ